MSLLHCSVNARELKICTGRKNKVMTGKHNKIATVAIELPLQRRGIIAINKKTTVRPSPPVLSSTDLYLLPSRA